MYTKEQKLNMFEKLSPDLKEVLTSLETGDKIMTVANKNSLMMDQITELSDEFSLLILGLTKSKDFVYNISKRLEIPYEKAKEIAQDINKDIVYPIRVSLQMAQDKEDNNIENTTQERPVIKPQINPSKSILTEDMKTGENLLPEHTGNESSIDTQKTYTESIDHKEISEIERFGNFKIERKEDPYREPLI